MARVRFACKLGNVRPASRLKPPKIGAASASPDCRHSEVCRWEGNKAQAENREYSIPVLRGNLLPSSPSHVDRLVMDFVLFTWREFLMLQMISDLVVEFSLLEDLVRGHESLADCQLRTRCRHRSCGCIRPAEGRCLLLGSTCFAVQENMRN